MIEGLQHIEGPLHNHVSQEILHNNINEFPLFKSIADKGKKKNKRIVRFYYYNSHFIGYLIYKTDNKKLNINNIEIRESLRKEKNRIKYGKEILTEFLNEFSNYDISLQTNVPKLKEYYKNLGFEEKEKNELWMTSI